MLIASMFIIPNFIESIDYGFVMLFCSRVLIALAFLNIGYYMFNYIERYDLKVRYILGILLLTMLLSKLNGYVDLNNLVFNNIIIYFVNGVMTSICIILLFKKCKNIKLLSYIGINSLIILATHQNFIYLLRRVLKYRPNDYISFAFNLTIIMMIEFFLINIINKYFGVILGKKRKNRMENKNEKSMVI